MLLSPDDDPSSTRLSPGSGDSSTIYPTHDTEGHVRYTALDTTSRLAISFGDCKRRERQFVTRKP